MWISKVAENTVLNNDTMSWQRQNTIFNLAECCISSIQLPDIIITNCILWLLGTNKEAVVFSIVLKTKRKKLLSNNVIVVSRDSSCSSEILSQKIISFNFDALYVRKKACKWILFRLTELSIETLNSFEFDGTAWITAGRFFFFN